MSAHTAMILDVQFLTEQVGFICGATSGDVQASHALILRTGDGGATWHKVHQGARPWETTWKMSWPSPKIGYVTIQSYDPDTTKSARYVAKSIDGGLTWTELPWVDDHAVRAFGIGFVDDRRGWIGAVPGGFETRDGGRTWTRVQMGNAVNKIRIVPRADGGKSVIGIGVELHRLDL